MRGPLSGMVTTSVGAVRRATATPSGAIVEPAVVTADEQGHGSVAVGLEGGLGREHVGRQAVVDELDRTDVADGVAAAGQAVEPLGRGGHQRVVAGLLHAHGQQHGAGDRCVAGVVLAGQAERLDPRPAEAGVACVHPLHVGPTTRPAPASGIGAVGDGRADPGLGAQGQLVGVVALDRAVPVEVVRRQGGHGHDRRPVGQIGYLIARCLDHPEVGLVPGESVPTGVGRCCPPPWRRSPTGSGDARRLPWWCSCPWCR